MTWLGSGSRAGSHCKERGRGKLTNHNPDNNKDKIKSRCKGGGDTDGYIGVLVENDLKEVRGEYRWGFEMLLRSEDVLLLPIWTWRGAGQICKHTKAPITLLTSPTFTTDQSVTKIYHNK